MKIWHLVLVVLIVGVLVRPAVWFFEEYRQLCIGMEWEASSNKQVLPVMPPKSSDNPWRD